MANPEKAPVLVVLEILGIIAGGGGVNCKKKRFNGEDGTKETIGGGDPKWDALFTLGVSEKKQM